MSTWHYINKLEKLVVGNRWEWEKTGSARYKTKTTLPVQTKYIVIACSWGKINTASTDAKLWHGTSQEQYKQTMDTKVVVLKWYSWTQFKAKMRPWIGDASCKNINSTLYSMNLFSYVIQEASTI